MTDSQGYSWKKKLLIALAVFVILLAAAYLPKMNQAGFLQDDWNTLFVTENRGAGELVFHFSIDRPLRGYFALVEDRLIGTNMAAFQLAALIWRLLDTIALYLILMLVWPGKWKTNVLICGLALIYPGFHEQLHAYDYQAHLFSRMSLLFSILFSLMPFYIKKTWLKVCMVIAAIVTAQISYGLMEAYIGTEALRFALLAIVYLQRRSSTRWWTALGYGLLFLLNAGGFIVWRLFIFEEKRASVDAESMFSGYSAFGAKLLEDLSAMGVNLYRLIVSAYYKPLVVFGEHLDRGDWIPGISIAILAAGFMIFIARKYLRNDDNRPAESRANYPLVLIAAGLAGCIGALAPIIFGGREITYIITGDRFSYPGSISACLVIIGIIRLIKARGVRLAVAGILVFLSVLTQFTSNNVFAKNSEQTNKVWWQMSWRAPQLEPGTLLSGTIYLGMLDEDYTLWGPANILYYPESRDITITAEVLNEETLEKFTSGKAALAERKGIAYTRDFGNLLLLSKAENACLHLIDGLHPEYSQGDDGLIREIGGLSQLERIAVDSTYNPEPRTDLFGVEPARDWCYFYQKAQLERQRRSWQTAANYAEEALATGHAPNDAMEWLVVLQAFAYTESDSYGEVLQAVLKDNYAAGQACQVFSSYTGEISETEFSDAHEELLMDVCGSGG